MEAKIRERRWGVFFFLLVLFVVKGVTRRLFFGIGTFCCGPVSCQITRQCSLAPIRGRDESLLALAFVVSIREEGWLGVWCGVEWCIGVRVKV